MPLSTSLAKPYLAQQIYKISLAMLLTVVFIASPAYAYAANWIQKRNESGIIIYQRELPGQVYRETKGTVEIGSTLAALVALLRDSSACTQWVYNCKESKTVATINSAERIFYTVIDAPLMFKDRDMYFHSKIKFYEKTETIFVALTGKENYAKGEQERVRVLDLKGSWEFQPGNAGKIQVSYQIYNNPQISMADTVNAKMEISVFKTLKGMREIVQKAPYRNAYFVAIQLDEITVD